MKSTLSHKVDVYETEDYDGFKHLLGNRPIDENHVRKLVTSMTKANSNITKRDPITLNENDEVIDGQHRIEALRRIKWPVYYIVSPGTDLTYTRERNNGSKNWSWQAYMHSYAESGNSHYKFFDDVMKTHTMRFSVVREYLQGSPTVKIHDFYDGKFIVKDKVKSLKLINQLQDILEIENIPERTFARAVYNIMTRSKYDHEHMLDVFTSATTALRSCYVTGQYIEVLENVYNNGLPLEERI